MASMSSKRWRCRYDFLAVVLVGGLTVVGCGSSDPSPSEISMAARAPYVAVVARDASALCADFTPKAASRLARNVSQNASCEERVFKTFVRAAPFEPETRPVGPNTFRASGIMRHGDVASVVIAYGTGGLGVQVTLKLTRIGSVWRVASRPMLRLVSGCYVRGVLTESCPKNAQVMLFSIGKPELRERTR
jgi:hypothetical protein